MKHHLKKIPGARRLWNAPVVAATRYRLRIGLKRLKGRWWRHTPFLRIRLNRLLGPYRVRKYRHVLRIMLTGTKGKTTTTHMIARIMTEAGRRVGFCSTDGVVIGNRMVQRGDFAGVSGAKAVLADPSVDCAVLETARGGLRMNGLYVPTCDAAALLNIGWDHIGTDGIDTQEAMLAIKRGVTDASRGRVVLNAEDALVAPLVRDYGVKRTTFFALDPAAVVDHLAQGGEAVTLTEGPEPRIVHRGSAGAVEIMPVADIPAAMGGRVPFIVANALAATGLARAVGVAPEVIAGALSTFGNTGSSLPGRFRTLSGYPFSIVIDRGHDVSGVEGFFSGITGIRNPGVRLNAMLTAVGNRPDWTFERIAEIAFEAGVDNFFLFDSDIIRRNRAPGEIPDRIEKWLIANGVAPDRISQFLDVRNAVRKMIADARAGDFLCFLGEHPKQNLEAIVLDELARAGHAAL